MSQQSDSAQFSIEDRILRDAGRWASERDVIKATCRKEPDELDDELAPMSAERAEQLVEKLLSLRQQLRPPPSLLTTRREIFAQRELDDGEPSDPDTLPTVKHHRTTSAPRPVPAANRGIPWRRVASYGGVALLASVVTVLVVRLGSSRAMRAGGEGYRMTLLQGTDAPTHHGAGDQGYCLDKEAQVRIEGHSPTPAVDGLEVVLATTSEAGPTHWYLHSPVADGWRVEPDGTALYFQGPFRELAALGPGRWTLTFQVGPRGSCGPHASTGCTVLDAKSVLIAPSDEC